MYWTELYINSFYMEEPREDEFEIIAPTKTENGSQDEDSGGEKVRKNQVPEILYPNLRDRRLGRQAHKTPGEGNHSADGSLRKET